VGSAKATDKEGRILSTEERGYGAGKRSMYRAQESGWRYRCMLPTLTGEALPVDIRLTPQQAACMMRVWGPESIGMYRERRRLGKSFVSRWVRGPVQSPGLTEEMPNDWRARMGFDCSPDMDPDAEEVVLRMSFA
jgi:hypothetical protein